MSNKNKTYWDQYFKVLGIIFFIGLLIFTIVCFFINYEYALKYKPDTIPMTEDEIIENCKNLDLKQTSYCLKENIKVSYNYNLSVARLRNEKIYNKEPLICKDGYGCEALTYEEILKEGGVCYDYAYLYERLAKELRFNATTRDYRSIENVIFGHRWAIIWNNEEYCILDMLNIECEKINKEFKNE